MKTNAELRRSGNEIQKTLTDEDVTELCSVAKKHWDKASKNALQVKFTWRGHKFISTLTTFRILVQTSKGEPVCCRWW